MKKIFSVFLATFLLLGAFAVGASALELPRPGQPPVTQIAGIELFPPAVVTALKLTDAQMAEAEQLYKELNKKYSAENGNPSAKLSQNFNKDLRKLANQFGIEVPGGKGFFAKAWNFILKWVFFGWIWM